MDIQQIFANNRKWIETKLSADGEYFKKLAEGQNPRILYIGCSDSRVTAEELMGVQPGEVFVHRNIANMVPANDLNSLSVVSYAVTHLKVDHIVVCGHYNCGGIKAAMIQEDFGILNPWLRAIRDVYRIHRDELEQISDEEQKYRRFIELNVQEQCVNIIKTPDAQRAILNRNVTLHGWVWDIHTGELIDLKIDFHSILNKIMEIYRIV
ncbi:MAG: carbonic anhydrase [Bacteroidetes bacterium]|nr:MAG: carbonic anhydrase [Bacteroidota bacterium]